MKKYGLAVLLPILVSVNFCNAQHLVSYNELVFKSEFEKKVFDDHFNNKKTDYFLLFMASGDLLNEKSVYEARDKFYAHLSTIGKENLAKKKNDKKIKFIYEDLHKSYLSRYQEENLFEEIFYNGNYNCVSASALHSLAFEFFGIPYSIKEKPSHVYLLAYPGSEKLVVETTNPNYGFMALSDQFKENYVKLLKNQKLIGAQEYASKDVNALFDQYYFASQEDISIGHLVGLQYFNKAVVYAQAKNFLEAFQQLEKAYLLYPSDRIAYWLMISGHQLLSSREEKDLIHAETLAKLSRYERYGITSDMIQGELIQTIQKLLFDRGQKEKLMEYHHRLDSLTINEDLKKQLVFVNEYETGRYYFNQAKYKQALPHFMNCIKVKPENQDALSLTIECISMSLSNKSNSDLVAALEDYAKQYPLLQSNDRFNLMMASAYLAEFGMNFEFNNASAGERYKTTFETFYKDHPDLALDRDLAGRAYSAAAVYYFKKGNMTKARAILARGLEISPGSYELLRRKEMMR